jgi:hypothetical protein
VLHVIAAVAERREQAVVEAGGARRRTVECERGCRCGKGQHGRADQEQPSHERQPIRPRDPEQRGRVR